VLVEGSMLRILFRVPLSLQSHLLVRLAFSFLGIDHTSVLGNTLAEIAHHKSGIFKTGVPAYSSNQPEEALAIIQFDAKEIEASNLTIVDAELQAKTIPDDVVIGLPGQHQRSNAALAVLVVKEFFKQFKQRRGCEFSPTVSDKHLPSEFLEGMRDVKWPGRGQIISYEGMELLLDGAHTVESIEACVGWVEGLPDIDEGVGLVFNCTGGRSARDLLTPVAGSRKSLGVFGKVVFCTNETYKDKGMSG
jgi:folylpolyglutamate synthase